MSSSASMRIDLSLVNAAKVSGALHSRSAAQQISHWARIGRELESASGVSLADVEKVLAGESSYDSLGAREQSVVRASWREGITEDIAELDLAAEFEAEGRTYTTAGKDGKPVTHAPQQPFHSE